MKRAMVIAAIAAGTLVLLPSALGAPHPKIQVRPRVVHAGGTVRIRGRAPGCPTVNSVTVMSRAFFKDRKHDFAGLGAVYLRQRPSHRFRGVAHIRRLARGTYRISARCGGANLGVAARVRVTRP
jgi:hypothetical protein